MKVGDLVKILPDWVGHYGIVTRIDHGHKQTKVDVLFSKGLQVGIWARHLKVINDK